MKKKILITLSSVLAGVTLLLAGYLLYVVLSYYRLEDNLPLKVEKSATDLAPTNEALSLITYNIGFGAYSADYSFFMDGGEHSRAFSKDAVIKNTEGSIASVKAQNPDFLLMQEVDIKGTRSYDVNQRELIQKSFLKSDAVFAQNYDSPYFLYPFSEPIGANISGLLTLSNYKISSATRRSLPIEDSFNKYLDLDRAYSVSVIKTNSGKDLVLYNVHLSAYTSDGSISKEQLKMLCEDMKKQCDKGNFVIAAGDFNKDLLLDSSKYFKRSEGEFNWAAPFNVDLLPEDFACHSGKNAPTCRNADAPFKGDGTDFVLSVDGVITSSNVEVLSCNTLDNKFAFSDHNPVKLEFKLKD